MEITTYFIISFIINLVLLAVLVVKSKNYHQLAVKYDALFGENSELIGRNAGYKSNIESFKKERDETATATNEQLLDKTKQIKVAQDEADALRDQLTDVKKDVKKLSDRNSKFSEMNAKQEEIITSCHKTIDEQSDKIKNLSSELKIAQKNDTPKDPETGKFTSKKKAKKKK